MPSPNMPMYETALVYPGGCLLEGTNLSEGQRHDAPLRDRRCAGGIPRPSASPRSIQALLLPQVSGRGRSPSNRPSRSTPVVSAAASRCTSPIRSASARTPRISLSSRWRVRSTLSSSSFAPRSTSSGTTFLPSICSRATRRHASRSCVGMSRRGHRRSHRFSRCDRPVHRSRGDSKPVAFAVSDVGRPRSDNGPSSRPWRPRLRPPGDAWADLERPSSPRELAEVAEERDARARHRNKGARDVVLVARAGRKARAHAPPMFDPHSPTPLARPKERSHKYQSE